MKDTPKKIGAVALAGVMVAGGTLQSGTIVSNAEGNNGANTKIATMKENIKVYDKESLLKEIKDGWAPYWRGELGLPQYINFKKLVPQFRQLNESLGNKVELIAMGRKELIDSIVSDTRYYLKERDDFGYEQIDYCYKDFNELRTGKVTGVERVVNLKGNGQRDYGGVPLKDFQVGKFYRVMIGDYLNTNRRICHIFFYVRK